MSRADAYNKAQWESGKLKPVHLTELGREWQRQRGLSVDGFIGPETLRSLDAVVDGRPAQPAGRCWPLRLLPDGRKPLITSAYYTKNSSRAAPDRRHYGVDLFYKYLASDPPMKLGDGGRDTKFWIPDGTMAIAAAPGRVHSAAFVGPTRTGHRLWIAHDGDYHTGYFHLGGLLVKPGQRVDAGDPLGPVSDNPADHDARHLHFEVCWGDLGTYPRGSFDPEVFLAGAAVLGA